MMAAPDLSGSKEGGLLRTYEEGYVGYPAPPLEELHHDDEGDQSPEEDDDDQEEEGSSDPEDQGSADIEAPGPNHLNLDDGALCYVDYTRPLGKGKFGEVFYAERSADRMGLAAKLVNLDNRGLRKREPLECEILRALGGTVAPKLWGMTKSDAKALLVMDLCGMSLDKAVSERQNSRLTVDETREIGIRCIDILEGIHKRGYVHGDIKPANFVFGHMGEIHDLVAVAHTLKAIDFGLAKIWQDSRTPNGHISYSQHLTRFSGSLRYASIHAHCGRHLSRRDDVESLAYMLMFLHRGPLPWQGFSEKGTDRAYRIFLAKGSVHLSDLCRDLPWGMLDYMIHVRSLKFDAVPDYKFLKDCLMQFQVGASTVSTSEHKIWRTAPCTAGVSAPKSSRKRSFSQISGGEDDDSQQISKRLKSNQGTLENTCLSKTDERNQWVMAFWKFAPTDCDCKGIDVPMDNVSVFTAKNMQNFVKHVREKLNAGFAVTSLAFNREEKTWVSFFAKVSDRIDGMLRKIKASSLGEHTGQVIERGVRILDIAASMTSCMVLEVRDHYIEDQCFFYGTSFPREWICQKWSAKFFITCLRFVGNSHWYVIMTKFSSESKKSWFYRSMFAGTHIPNTKFLSQKIELSFSYPSESVRSHWNHNMVVTSVASCPTGLTAFVLSKFDVSLSQHIVRTKHLEENLRHQTEQDYFLFDATFGRVF